MLINASTPAKPILHFHSYMHQQWPYWVPRQKAAALLQYFSNGTAQKLGSGVVVKSKGNAFQFHSQSAAGLMQGRQYSLDFWLPFHQGKGKNS